MLGRAGLCFCGVLLFFPITVFAGVCPAPTSTTNLQSFYEAEGDATDSVGANDGTLQNGATFGAGHIGQSFALDGSNDYVSLPLSGFSGASQVSYGGWFKKTTYPGSANGYGLITSTYTGGGNIGHALQFFPPNQNIYVYLNNTSNFVKSGRIPDNGWHHVFVVFDGTKSTNQERLRIFIDGVYEFEATGGTIPSTISIPQFFLGSNNTYTNFTTWDGGIDEVRFYDRALSDYEVKSMYINESGGCTLLSDEAVTIDDNTFSTATNMTFSFTNPGGVAAGQSMTLYFPEGFDLSAIDYTDIDVTYDDGGVTELTLGATRSGSTWSAVVDGENLVIRSATGTIPAGSLVAIEIGTHATAGTTGDAQITTPSEGGYYTVDINSTFGDAGDIAIFIDGPLSVTASAIVSDALIMVLNATGVNLLVDPAVNNGQNLAEQTVITVSSNAVGGYAVQARLDDGAGNARLVDGNGNFIESNSSAGDNYIGYTARNDGTGSPVTAEQDFTNVSSALLDGSSDVIGLGTTTNSQQHTVNYDLNVNFLTPAGVYTGTVYYTVIANF